MGASIDDTCGSLASDKPLLKASSERAILTRLAQIAWQHQGWPGLCPVECVPIASNLTAWIHEHRRTELPAECIRHYRACLLSHADQELKETEIRWAGRPRREPLPNGDDWCLGHRYISPEKEWYRWDVVRPIHKTWVQAAEHRGKQAAEHPLLPLVRAWQRDTAIPAVTVGADQRPGGILPASLAHIKHPPASTDQRRDLALPALVLGLYQRPDSEGTTTTGRVSVLERLLVELLLAVPQDDRTDQIFRRHVSVTVREIVIDWLGWDPRHYRWNRENSGHVLKAAASRLAHCRIPLGDYGGGVRPCALVYEAGWRLRDKLTFSIVLPKGSRVGAWIDRDLLRRLGRNAPAWRALLTLSCLWNQQGGWNGKLVRPNRPIVKRNPYGELLDSEGKVIRGKRRVPIKSPHHEAAVRLGGREPNPARTRYPSYDADGLVGLCYRPDALDEPHLAKVLRVRARQTMEELRDLGGCFIEKLGDKDHRLPWRPMPPDPPEISAEGASKKRD